MRPLRSKPEAPKPVPPTLPDRLKAAIPSARPGPSPSQFDKAFPVLVRSDIGVANGVGRNISATGMFIETREPCTIGTHVRVTFSADSVGTELVAIGEVRFQCFLNFNSEDGQQEGLRGMGIRFLGFEEPAGVSRKPVTLQ